MKRLAHQGYSSQSFKWRKQALNWPYKDLSIYDYAICIEERRGEPETGVKVLFWWSWKLQLSFAELLFWVWACLCIEELPYGPCSVHGYSTYKEMNIINIHTSLECLGLRKWGFSWRALFFCPRATIAFSIIWALWDKDYYFLSFKEYISGSIYTHIFLSFSTNIHHGDELIETSKTK